MRKAGQTPRKLLSWGTTAFVLVALLFIVIPLCRTVEFTCYTSGGRVAAFPVLTPLPAEFLFNGGDLDEMDNLPGIGEVLARRIIDEREINGPYYFAEDVMYVPGIGEKRFADIMDWLDEHTVNAEVLPN